MKNFEEIFDELFLFDDAMDKYEWIMDYGEKSGGVPPDSKISKNLVQGCSSRLWLIKLNGAVQCDADSAIVKGFAGMICYWWNQASSDQQKEFSLNTLMAIGLAPLISMGRQNGIANLINAIKKL